MIYNTKLMIRGLAQAHLRIGSGQIRWRTRFAYPTGMSAYEDDYVDVPQYPNVDYETRHYSDRQKKKRQDTLDWHSAIRNKETVEEKLMELNINRGFGWMSFILNEDFFHYDALPFMKYITRTHLISNEFPQVYSSPELLAKVDHYSQILQKPLEDVMKFEIYGVNRIRKENESLAAFSLSCNQAVVNQVSRVILQVLAAEEPMLKEARVDYRPKSEAFWLVGGFPLFYRQQKKLKDLEKKGKDKHLIDEKSFNDMSFQYIGTPLIQIRSKTPLEWFHDSAFEVDSIPLSQFAYTPLEFGYFKKMYYATNIPGHWTGDTANSNLLSFHSSHFLEPTVTDGTPLELDPVLQPSYISRKSELMQAQAILNSFSKLLAQAYTLGFDQFGDLDYPLTSQMVLCNGLDWSFSSYQLNTIKLDGLNLKKNQKQNYCWSTSSMRIFEESGNLNLSALEMLLKFYLTPTLSKQEEFRTPYVKHNLNDLTDDYKREFILSNFHEMYSQRRMTHIKMAMPEIYPWERIYKIAHKKRPFDSRKRFFEIPGNNPYTYKYLFKEPRYRPKRLKFLEAELEEKKEKARVEASKDAQAIKFKEIVED